MKRVSWIGASVLAVPLLGLASLGLGLCLLVGRPPDTTQPRDKFLQYVAPVIGEVRENADGEICATAWGVCKNQRNPSGDQTKVGFADKQEAWLWVCRTLLKETLPPPPPLSPREKQTRLRVEWRDGDGNALKTEEIEPARRKTQFCGRCGKPMTPGSPIDGSVYCYNEDCEAFEVTFPPPPPAGENKGT